MTAEELIRATFDSGDAHGGVWLGCVCAAAVLPRVTPGDDRPTEAVRLAQRWAHGEPIAVDDLWAARATASEAASEAAEAAWAAAEAASGAASEAAEAAADAVWAAGTAVAAAAWARAEAGAWASAAVWAARATQVAAGRADPSIDFVALLRYEIEPIVPTLGDVGAARPEAAVIWDCYAVELGPVRFGSLGDALSRARVLGLDWQAPVERALAERLPLDHPAWVAVKKGASSGTLASSSRL